LTLNEIITLESSVLSYMIMIYIIGVGRKGLYFEVSKISRPISPLG
jgi:hypothetical protein